MECGLFQDRERERERVTEYPFDLDVVSRNAVFIIIVVKNWNSFIFTNINFFFILTNINFFISQRLTIVVKDGNILNIVFLIISWFNHLVTKEHLMIIKNLFLSRCNSVDSSRILRSFSSCKSIIINIKRKTSRYNTRNKHTYKKLSFQEEEND
ncbi:hypothetical protein HYC85_016961 [Camellia sinensis]|uniref:Uncharacterized protein n=1 Tax=Camellia sinensis TaxID=4442 RepID=A0A7J7H173_CAMSI|nr:hypothetical protein HYC85_016961 [Camellia sinensis]